MRRFSRTVRLGKIPRPSGIAHRPARASFSVGVLPTGRSPITHLAGGRPHAPADDLEQRRLAGAVGAEQGEDAPGRNDQVDAVEHLDPPVGGADPATVMLGRELRRRRAGRPGRCGRRQLGHRLPPPSLRTGSLRRRAVAEVGGLDHRVVADLSGGPEAMTSPKSST